MSRSDSPAAPATLLKIIISGFLLSALLAANGCTLINNEEGIKSEPKAPQTESYVSPFRKVTGPVNLNFMTVNKHREHYKETSDSSGHREMKLTISGLVKKEIEQKIND